MKYVILIHSNPQPWGHPTADYLPEHQALPEDQRKRLNKDFEDGFAQVMERGEFVHAEALGAPSTSRLFRWSDGDRVVADGPYAEGREHFAGFFVIDVETQERAEQIAALFSGPGGTVELRPVMSGGPQD
ncbi:MAG TPA: YciI family protein [Actinocatenispora sp.]